MLQWSGLKTDLSNYGSIFLLDTIGKFYASMLCRRLKIHMATKFSKTQYGFCERQSAEEAILWARTIVQKTLDERWELVLVFIDLRKAFDSLHITATVNRTIDINYLWNPVYLIKLLVDLIHRRTKDCFRMELGTRQNVKEGSLPFNITFQLILEEAFSSIEECAIPMKRSTGDRWSLTRCGAPMTCILWLQRKKLQPEFLRKYHMQIAADKTFWLHVGVEDDQATLEATGISHSLGSVISEIGEPDGAISANLVKAKSQLIRTRPFRRAKDLSTPLEVKLVKILMDPFVTYGLSTVIPRARKRWPSFWLHDCN